VNGGKNNMWKFKSKNNNNKFVLITDDHVQWFSYLVEYNDQTVIAYTPYSFDDTEYGCQIYTRSIRNFNFLEIPNGPSFYGWDLSEYEFSRLARLQELRQATLEFKLLSSLS
jgi:hypothetical protein